MGSSEAEGHSIWRDNLGGLGGASYVPKNLKSGMFFLLSGNACDVNDKASNDRFEFLGQKEGHPSSPKFS